MQEKINFLENLNKLYNIHLANMKGSRLIAEDELKQIYEDNKRLTSEKADIEYFIGITENWHNATEYEKQKKRSINYMVK